ncbi:hypothetical protein SAMN05421780_101500 [Flexibacter flexilis DSM 6793]|uniref:Uncharacterized protein n=1 Tax=Flexibacter flexilis DSM 6793 TaxID=927664 RepID=A0A1I1E1N8_9BACT|nr:hypothetical protein SAMN05421780_101500 [Flexibacter flexilis DSM 6793]
MNILRPYSLSCNYFKDELYLSCIIYRIIKKEIIRLNKYKTYMIVNCLKN